MPDGQWADSRGSLGSDRHARAEERRYEKAAGLIISRIRCCGPQSLQLDERYALARVEHRSVLGSDQNRPLSTFLRPQREIYRPGAKMFSGSIARLMDFKSG